MYWVCRNSIQTPYFKYYSAPCEDTVHRCKFLFSVLLVKSDRCNLQCDWYWTPVFSLEPLRQAHCCQYRTHVFFLCSINCTSTCWKSQSYEVVCGSAAVCTAYLSWSPDQEKHLLDVQPWNNELKKLRRWTFNASRDFLVEFFISNRLTVLQSMHHLIHFSSWDGRRGSCHIFWDSQTLS